MLPVSAVPPPVPTRVRGLSGGARSLAENGRCARSPRPPPPSAAPGTALERLQPRARRTHAPTRRRLRVRVRGSSAPGGRRRRRVLGCSAGESPRAFRFLYHLLNIARPAARLALTSHPAAGVRRRTPRLPLGPKDRLPPSLGLGSDAAAPRDPCAASVSAPSAVAPAGWVERGQSEPPELRSALRSWSGGAAPRIPSEWTGDVATGLASGRTWVWPRSW